MQHDGQHTLALRAESTRANALAAAGRWHRKLAHKRDHVALLIARWKTR